MRKAASGKISKPIDADDIEIEICWATRARQGIRADVDNIIKPTIDALKGIAFNDDQQVRSFTGTLFDLLKAQKVDGYVEDMGPLFYSGEDAVLIAIYSDTRLEELGGEEKVRRQRSDEIEEKFKQSPNGVQQRVLGFGAFGPFAKTCLLN